MALANKATNVTLYDLGGSGDNIVPDGFIKTVEKVWVDTLVFSSALTIGIGMIVDVAKIPKGKKITGITVHGLNEAQVGTLSNTTISIGARYGSGAVTNATQFLAATTIGTTSFDVQPITAGSNIGVEVTGSTHTIFLHFGVSSPTITAGTVTSIVKYT